METNTEKQPYKVQLEKGVEYKWCTCGVSKTLPFCDGRHKVLAPGFKSLRFTVEEDGDYLLCGCQKTKNPPFCDLSHTKSEENRV